MSSGRGHKHTSSVTQNHKALLANAYNELGKELSSTKIRVVGNYTLGKVIGEGAYGKVRLGTHRLTSTRVAIKQVPKGMSSSLTREIHHHRQLHHPHITQMYEVIATESFIWIVTELCCGGELFDYLAEKGRLGEDETRVLFGQLCLAVAYLHDKGIVHRDLKLENVLLDERCRIKLGDFGFTREFERGAFLETFCGTTGYASPEMLQGKKYQGPEVDIWSLGIILYCLLTGTLPFDDDEETVMRAKIIKGDFQDPEWLSIESRDLIKRILQKDPAKRLGISQIFAHPWFTTPPSSVISNSSFSHLPPTPLPLPSPQSSDRTSSQTLIYSHSSEALPLSAASDSSYVSASSEFDTSTLTPPDASPSEFLKPDGTSAFHRNPSEITIKNSDTEIETLGIRRPNTDLAHLLRLETSVSEDHQEETTFSLRSVPKPPPAYSVRTPIRTKRRSVSSNLSDPASPTADKPQAPLPHQDFASLLSTPAPIIFSTALERNLLNNLSTLGFDTAQIVHSVLSNACDAAGAVWWILKRKTEKKAAEAEDGKSTTQGISEKPREVLKTEKPESRKLRGVSVQTDDLPQPLSLARSAPQLAFVPPTPTLLRPATPPDPISPPRPLLSPSPSSRSHPSTPAGSLRDKDNSKGRRDGKARSGSVSIMQRATTALEAAGLVRKKSTEAVRDEKEREREKSKDSERRIGSGDEPRSSHGSGSSKLSKSPHPKGAKDYTSPSTPPPPELRHPQPHVGSPWVITEAQHSPPPQGSAPTPSNPPGEAIPSLNLSESISKAVPRNRASLLTAFRLWFHEDRKGKRKESSGGKFRTPVHGRTIPTSSSFTNNNGTVKRRTSGSGGKFASRQGGHRPQRPSISSRRSSSVNSRRSSGTSAQIILLDSPHIIEQLSNRRSIGSHTPNSDRGDFSSRPSSVRSLSMQRHRKSPSASSAGSAHFRTASPLQKHHKRSGSGSSTKVVRQVQPAHNASARHHRSNSTTSSIHSPTSSRPTSFYEDSDAPRTISPFRRRSSDGPAYGSTTFVAQKKQAPFMSPAGYLHGSSIGRSSWKKSWGMEPPGWQSRTTHIPIEVLAVSPPDTASGIRDVFSGKQSLSIGDESDWVDEDDDVPAFAGGLGQLTTSPSNPPTFPQSREATVTLSPPPRGHRAPKRANRNAGGTPGHSSLNSNRQKSVHTPVERTTPLPTENVYDTTETRGGRRQLPSARSGPAFRHAIQEEDEGEEE